MPGSCGRWRTSGGWRAKPCPRTPTICHLEGLRLEAWEKLDTDPAPEPGPGQPDLRVSPADVAPDDFPEKAGNSAPEGKTDFLKKFSKSLEIPWQHIMIISSVQKIKRKRKLHANETVQPPLYSGLVRLSVPAADPQHAQQRHPLYLDSIGFSTSFSGLLGVPFALLGIVGRMLGGYLVDRRGRRIVMVGGTLLMGVAAFLLGLLPLAATMLLFRALTGVGFSRPRPPTPPPAWT